MFLGDDVGFFQENSLRPLELLGLHALFILFKSIWFFVNKDCKHNAIDVKKLHYDCWMGL